MKVMIYRISLDEILTKKIAEIFTPRNKKELESFFGLNIYLLYLPKYSDLIEPFARLCKMDTKTNYCL